MIISNIIGGVGNQMFQYAAGRSLSLKTGEDLFLAADQFGLIGGQTTHNGLELMRAFCVKAKIAESFKVAQLIGWRHRPYFRRYISTRYGGIFSGPNFVAEPCFEYWDGFEKLSGNKYLHGYWQSCKYFKMYEKELREDFKFKLNLSDDDGRILEKMRMQPSASIHVRKGDYASKKNSTIYQALNKEYYSSAIEFIRKKVPGIKFYVFSDDFHWASSVLDIDGCDVENVSHNRGERSIFDMNLMSCADHNIIANSTFSWWSAWLNESSDKIVVAPKKWFCNGINEFDLIPNEWVRV